MFTDARTLPEGTLVEADVAVIGGGPAGITLARSFANSATKVCIVEAGGRQADLKVQSLYEGENVGLDYPLVGARLRFFGGSSNHWGGYCRPLDPIDFEQRDWVPYSGWPFGVKELDAYYQKAGEIVEIAPVEFANRGYWERATGEALPKPVVGRMQMRYLQFSPPTRFGIRYGPELERAKNVQVLLNANVVNIAAVESGRAVRQLDVRTLEGHTHRVRAHVYVLATGGLENARMLLLSNDVVPKGLGNDNDLVGRFFMEHPHLAGFGNIVITQPGRFPKIYLDRMEIGGQIVKACFDPTEQFLRAQHLLNATFTMSIAGEYPEDTPPTTGATISRSDMLKAAHHFLTETRVPADSKKPKSLGYWLGVGCACEQVPNPLSRVTLAKERDALGLRKIRLDWRLTEQDRRSVVTHIKSLALEFGANGKGRMLVKLGDDDPWPDVIAGGNHHMGTTRMHDDPKQGVVDRNSQVHGMANLYVAGSSVFPTAGSGNPTLTIVALTLRLADHLRTTV